MMNSKKNSTVTPVTKNIPTLDSNPLMASDTPESPSSNPMPARSSSKVPSSVAPESRMDFPMSGMPLTSFHRSSNSSVYSSIRSSSLSSVSACW